MFPFSKQTDKSALSLPKSIRARGYEIKKMPIGAYLNAIEKMKTLPNDFMSKCFPGKSLQEVIDLASKVDEHSITELAAGLFAALPGYFIGFVSDLTGIDEDCLINDENIGLDGLVEIIRAFIEVNDLGKLRGAVNELKVLLKQAVPIMTPSTGSKE